MLLQMGFILRSGPEIQIYFFNVELKVLLAYGMLMLTSQLSHFKK